MVEKELDIYREVEVEIVDYDLLNDEGKCLLRKDVIDTIEKLGFPKEEILKMNHTNAFDIGYVFIQYCEILMSEHLDKTEA